jgi:cell pole-organizing protein PopZ
VGEVTAEPRMEDLLASIRKAIHEDIGDMPSAGQARAYAPAVPPQAPQRVGDELAAAASEIQQLREKISRARAGRPVPPAEPVQRAATLAAALQNDTPRRNWRELEPTPLPPRLRGSALETEVARVLPPRPEAVRAPVRSEAPAILSGNSAQAVNAAFGKLADSVLTRATNDRSVEEVTRELLRVMLKQWLDENLPSMVERLVREEIERVARTGR